MSGGKDDDVVIGYRYLADVHFVLCEDELDELGEIIIAERQAWQGSQTTNGTIHIDKQELFGGETREGGVFGDVDVMMGGENQTTNPRLIEEHGPNIPAYRGVTSLLFKAFQWASGNPYFKAPWFRVRRIHSGWGDINPPTLEYLYSPGHIENWLTDLEAPRDPRNCRNEHEYAAVVMPGTPGSVPGATWGTFDKAIADLTAYYGPPITENGPVGYTNHYGNIHGYGFDDPAEDNNALSIGLCYPLNPYETVINARFSGALNSNLYSMLAAGEIEIEKPFFWAGVVPYGLYFSAQRPGLYLLRRHHVNLYNPSFVMPPGGWATMNNARWPELIPNSFRGWISIHYQGLPRVACRRKITEPDDPCSPRCTPEWPPYAGDPLNYCDVNGTIVKRVTWTPVTGEFKSLSKSIGSSPANALLLRPLGPTLPKGHPDYNNEAFWTGQYDSAVTAGWMPSGMTYAATPSPSNNTYPRAMNDAPVWKSSEQYEISGGAWENGLAQIGRDMNPAHIIYQCLTNAKWGMGYPTADIDETSFLQSAQKLFDEGFGLSFHWKQQMTIQDFIKMVLTHINGKLTLDMSTGKFVLKLIRDDIDTESLVVLNSSNILELKSFQRAAYGDAANEVVVKYRDRFEDEKSVAVQDLAAIQSQGGIVSTTRDYEGIHEDYLAARVAARDLATLSGNLAKISCTVDRILWDKIEGDAVAVTWGDPINITGGVFRIVKINKGDLANGRIEVDLVEDVFGLPTNVYTVTPPTEWTDPVNEPNPVDAARAIEATYWEVVRTLPTADREVLQAGYGFVSFLALKNVSDNPLNYKLMYAPTLSSIYSEVGTGYFNSGGTLSIEIGYKDTVLYVKDHYNLSEVILGSDNGYVIVDDEYMEVVSVDVSTGRIGVKRGVLDTVPYLHLAETKVYFMNRPATYDPTERTDGEIAHYKLLPATGLGTLDVDDATPVSITLNNRATRPYPPGDFKLNDVAYPETIFEGDIKVTWSHRDRLSQTVELIDTTVGNIGPEEGTTYRLRISDAVTDDEIASYTGLTGTEQIVPAFTAAKDIRITLGSTCDGLDSWQDHNFVINYFNTNAMVDETGGNVFVTEDDLTMITED